MTPTGSGLLHLLAGHQARPYCPQGWPLMPLLDKGTCNDLPLDLVVDREWLPMHAIPRGSSNQG